MKTGNKDNNDDDGDGTETEDEAPLDNTALKEDDSDSDESVAEAVDEPIPFDNSIQPLDPMVANTWNFSTKKKM